MMLYHFSKGSNRMFSEREKRLIFWEAKEGSEKKEVKGGAEKEKQPTDTEKIEQLMTEVKQLREMLGKRESQATNIVNSSYAPRVGPDRRLQLPPDISGHPCMNTDACRGYVIDGQRSRYGLMSVHAAMRARNRAKRTGYRRSTRVRGPSSGGTIESVQDPDAQARMYEIRNRSRIIGRNRVDGREYNTNSLYEVKNRASWRRNGTQMYNHMYASRDLAREMGIEGWGKAPTSYNDAMFVGHQERLGLTGSMPMGYGSNNYVYMENPWMKRGGFDSKGRPIDRQGAFRNYLMKSGYIIPPRPRGSGGGSINEYWDSVNHDRLNNGEFDDLKGDPKYEELMKIYRRRMDFGMDDNPKYFVHELETLRRLRKGAQRMDAEIPQEKVIYTHSIENNSELGYGYATITLEDKIDPATGKPRVITLRDIRSNRVGEVDLSFGKSTGLIFENGIRITTNRYDKGATGSDYNRYGNISGFNFGFTKPGIYTIRYRSSAGQGQERVDRITINPDGSWSVGNEFANAPGGAAQKNPGRNTLSSKLDNSRKGFFTSEAPEASTPVNANDAQKAAVINIANEFNLVHRNRVGLYSQVQRPDGSITIYARNTGTENWTRIDIDTAGRPTRSRVEIAADPSVLPPVPAPEISESASVRKDVLTGAAKAEVLKALENSPELQKQIGTSIEWKRMIRTNNYSIEKKTTKDGEMFYLMNGNTIAGEVLKSKDGKYKFKVVPNKPSTTGGPELKLPSNADRGLKEMLEDEAKKNRNILKGTPEEINKNLEGTGFIYDSIAQSNTGEPRYFIRENFIKPELWQRARERGFVDQNASNFTFNIGNDGSISFNGIVDKRNISRKDRILYSNILNEFSNKKLDRDGFKKLHVALEDFMMNLQKDNPELNDTHFNYEDNNDYRLNSYLFMSPAAETEFAKMYGEVFKSATIKLNEKDEIESISVSSRDEDKVTDAMKDFIKGLNAEFVGQSKDLIRNVEKELMAFKRRQVSKPILDVLDNTYFDFVNGEPSKLGRRFYLNASRDVSLAQALAMMQMYGTTAIEVLISHDEKKITGTSLRNGVVTRVNAIPVGKGSRVEAVLAEYDEKPLTNENLKKMEEDIKQALIADADAYIATNKEIDKRDPVGKLDESATADVKESNKSVNEILDGSTPATAEESSKTPTELPDVPDPFKRIDE